MLSVLFPEEGESWNAFTGRMDETSGELLIILSGVDKELERDEHMRRQVLDACAKIGHRLRIATKNRVVVAAARTKGLRVIDRAADLKKLLHGHRSAGEAFRAFSPQIWRQQLRSRLQSMGLLSLPKLRIWTLIAVSAILFFFVFFRLLPSAEVRVWPREDTISQTANIFLVLSGSTVDIPQRVRTMDLIPIVVEISKTLTFDQISKEFIGTNAEVAMTIINNSDERFSLRGGSRLSNQAGMIFRIQEPIIIDPGEEITVLAVADDLDLFGEIIGERGNVPAGLKWDFLGLVPSERKLVYGENSVDATGGKMSYKTVLHEEDLEIARRRLEQELLATAKQLVDEHRTLFNAEHSDEVMEILYYDELTKSEFKDFVLPTQFLGETVTSIPIEGTIVYTAYAYDTQYVLELLSDGIKTHVGEGRRILEDTLRLDRLVAHVIDYEDDLSWIKLTVDLSGTEQSILDPLTPMGALFAKQVREKVVDISREEAVRIVKNLPEVENVEISVWPPWSRTLPHLPSHITIVPVHEPAPAAS